MCQNANDLAREAVGWNGGLGGNLGIALRAVEIVIVPVNER
jgi:hypothetical protein